MRSMFTLSLVLLYCNFAVAFSIPPLVDMRGQVHELGASHSLKATVIIFVSPDCPLCQRYAPTLNKLAAELPPGVELFGVVSGNLHTHQEVIKYATDFKLTMPILVDPLQTLAKWLKPTHAPEAFVLLRDGTVVYRGRINNWYEAPSRPRSVVTSHDLKDAITAVAKGEKPKVSKTTPVGCSMEDEPELPKAVTFNKHIAPLLASRCATCHRPGEVAPFSLLTYADAKKRAKQMVQVCEGRIMPPWKAEPGYGHFVGERRLLDVEIRAIQAWVNGGTPEGDKEDKLPEQVFASEWHLGKPDLVIKMPEAYTVPATGKDVLRNFVIPIPEADNQFVVAMEFRPGNRKVVHHALCLLDATGMGRKLDAAEPGYGYDAEKGGIGVLPTGSLGGWAPGVVPRFLPDGMGRFLGKGSDLILQVHYHPSGKEEKDQSELAVYFAKKPVTKPLTGINLENWEINIPPGEKRYHRTASYTLPVDVTFVGVAPHMHLLGKEMKAWAELPDGKTRPLIHVKEWDFNWQDYYVYQDSFTLPKGTKLRMEGWHDNSESNPANPWKPLKRISYGEATDNEMSLCIFEVTTNTLPEIYRLIFDNVQHNKIIERFSFAPKR